jgi:hypothetical protein
VHISTLFPCHIFTLIEEKAKTNVEVEWLAMLLRIRRVPGSNLGPDTGNPPGKNLNTFAAACCTGGTSRVSRVAVAVHRWYTQLYCFYCSSNICVYFWGFDVATTAVGMVYLSMCTTGGASIINLMRYNSIKQRNQNRNFYFIFKA